MDSYLSDKSELIQKTIMISNNKKYKIYKNLQKKLKNKMFFIIT